MRWLFLMGGLFKYTQDPADVLSKHYDRRIERELMEQRRRHLDNL